MKRTGNCTNCRFAFFKQTKSGRRDLNFGECTVEVKLPLSFKDYRGDFPTRRSISKYTDGLCSFWKPIETNKTDQ